MTPHATETETALSPAGAVVFAAATIEFAAAATIEFAAAATIEFAAAAAIVFAVDV